MKLRTIGVLGAAGLLAVASALPAAAQDRVLKVGITLPLSGNAAADGVPTSKGAQLAVAQANAAGGIGGYTIEFQELDHAVNGQYNEQQAAQDMQTFVADPAVVAVVGPYNSAVGRAQIPISNDAGLLQCSPANTAEGLTKPEFGGLELRRNFPDRINYIRVATTDDVQGPAAAAYAFDTLGLTNVIVIDDVTTFGTGVADNFQRRFEELGGTVSLREGAPPDTTDFNGVIANFPADAQALYYGGVVTSGGGLLLRQMRQQGVTFPFLGPDGIVNGSGNAPGSLIQIAGLDATVGTVGTIAAIGDFPAKAQFDEAYIAQFGTDATFGVPGAYSGPGHACATIVLESLRAFLEANPDADLAAIREGVRAHATNPDNSFETVLGITSFDENGDNRQKFISFYVVDPAAADGAGDWVFKEQQDFGATAD